MEGPARGTAAVAPDEVSSPAEGSPCDDVIDGAVVLVAAGLESWGTNKVGRAAATAGGTWLDDDA
jgi:hypothetical protein